MAALPNHCLIARLHHSLISRYWATSTQRCRYVVTCVTIFFYSLTCCARQWQPKWWEAPPGHQLPLGILGHLRLDPGLQPDHGRCLRFGAVAFSLCFDEIEESRSIWGSSMACFGFWQEERNETQILWAGRSLVLATAFSACHPRWWFRFHWPCVLAAQAETRSPGSVAMMKTQISFKHHSNTCMYIQVYTCIYVCSTSTIINISKSLAIDGLSFVAPFGPRFLVYEPPLKERPSFRAHLRASWQLAPRQFLRDGNHPFIGMLTRLEQINQHIFRGIRSEMTITHVPLLVASIRSCDWTCWDVNLVLFMLIFPYQHGFKD